MGRALVDLERRQLLRLQAHGIDDVGFMAALLGDLGRRAAIDPRRVYVAGHSNGGMMAHRLGEELPGRFAAIASVAGAHVPSAGSGQAVPVLHIHSVDDPRALYGGGLGPPFPLTGSRVLHPPVDATLSAWARRDGCGPTAAEQEFRKSAEHTARRLVYGNCRDGVEVALWKLAGAGHGWPGGRPVGSLARPVDPGHRRQRRNLALLLAFFTAPLNMQVEGGWWPRELSVCVASRPIAAIGVCEVEGQVLEWSCRWQTHVR